MEKRPGKTPIKRTNGEQLADIDGREEDYETIPLSESLPWYPALAPPTGSKNDVFNVDDFKDVDARARNAHWELNRSFRDLINYLTTGLPSDLAKLRAIFMWMGAQNIVISADKYSSCPSPTIPEYLMKSAAEGDNSSFVELFAQLCRKAKVPCITVKGIVKAAAYDPGHKNTCGPGIWTVVHISSGWRFVHPLWAFKFVQNYNRGVWVLVEDTGKAARERIEKDEGEAKGHVDEFWFLTDPEDLNFLCHSEDPRKQLLKHPWTIETFLGLAGLKADFFKSRWKLLGPHKSVIETQTGKCSIDFQHPVEGKAEVRYRLFFMESQSKQKLPAALQIDLYVTRLKSGNGVVSLITRLPVPGLYKLEVTGIHNRALSVLGQFCLHCTAVSPNPQPFPSNPENGFGYDETSKEAGISNPSQTEGVMLVSKGETVDFSFQMDEDKELQPKLVHGLKRPEELSCHVTVVRNRDQVKVEVDLPRDDSNPEYSLEIYVGGRRHSESSEEPRSHGKSVDSQGAGMAGQLENSAPKDPEIQNKYKRSNSTLDPVTVTGEANPTNRDADISNSYRGSNSTLDPVSSPAMDAFRAINALNYLLTSDKELHDESSGDTKEFHRELQEALEQDDEAMIRQALKRFEEAELEDPVSMAKVKAKEQLWMQTRDMLQKAVATHSMTRINKAVGEFTSHKMENTGEIEPAVNELMSLSKQTVAKAVSSKSARELDSALRRVRDSHVAKKARAAPWFREAQNLRTNQAVEEMCGDLVTKVNTTSVVGFGDRPLNRQLMAVLKATLCLLGENEETLRSGQSIKSRLRETIAGKSLLHCIKNFQVQQTTKNHVHKAKRELSICNGEELEKDSGVAARRLLDWCSGMVTELCHHIWSDEDNDDDD